VWRRRQPEPLPKLPHPSQRSEQRARERLPPALAEYTEYAETTRRR
jgi:hypothetical protein